ncbi:MAG: transporter [Deltaproteobacteria bacterium]|nr:transporter [Deltaproteobacteria bacterium]
MTKKVRIIVVVLILAALLASAGAEAAAPLPDPLPTTGPIITDTAVPQATGALTLQPYWSLGLVGGRFSANWRRVSAGGNFASLEMPVKLTYGPAPKTEVSLQAALLQNWAGQVEAAGPGGSRAAAFTGLGDIYFEAKYQLLEETARRPTVSAILIVNFPSGHHFRLNPGRLDTDALGGGTWAFTPGVNLAKRLGPVYLYANLWYSFPTRNPGVPVNQQAGPILFPVHGRDLITANFAAEWALTPQWVALLEFYNSWDAGPLFRHSREPLSSLTGVLPGIEFIFSPRWSAALGVAVDLAGKNSFYSYTPIFTVLLNY